jgi:hypothetical protein
MTKLQNLGNCGVKPFRFEQRPVPPSSPVHHLPCQFPGVPNLYKFFLSLWPDVSGVTGSVLGGVQDSPRLAARNGFRGARRRGGSGSLVPPATQFQRRAPWGFQPSPSLSPLKGCLRGVARPVG